MSNKLNELQIILLEMMKALHALCEQHGLRYYVIGGTMLGAARHQGFIPWDDDIDVGMPREDFEKLASFANELSDRYVIEMPDSEDENYTYCYGKMYDKNTVLIESKARKLVRGVYIDIFPLDGIGNSKMEYLRYYCKIYTQKMFLDLMNMKESSRRSYWKNITIRMSTMLPNCWFSEKKIMGRITRACKKRNFENSKYGGNLVGAWGRKEIMKNTYYGNPRIYSFEEITVYGVENSEEYLSSLYGDWRKLPSKEKQVTHHDYYLDLHTPYEEYTE